MSLIVQLTLRRARFPRKLAGRRVTLPSAPLTNSTSPSPVRFLFTLSGEWRLAGGPELGASEQEVPVLKRSHTRLLNIGPITESRRLLNGLVLVATLLVGAACSSSGNSGGAAGAPTCAQGPASCRCKSSPFTLAADETPVANCDSVGSGTWVCSYDLNSAGESTTCECDLYGCSNLNSSVCVCGFGSHDTTSPQTATCQPTSSSEDCCTRSDNQSESAAGVVAGGIWLSLCECTAGTKCGVSVGSAPSQVASCDLTPPAWFQPSGHTAASCSGITWAPPPEAGAGSSSGGSGCPGGCGACEQCVGNTCHSCGYGVTGGCNC
jgi:hypothetical protein